MTQEKWGQLRQRLLKTVGQNNYKTWIEPLQFRGLQDGIATFNVPTNFMGNYVSQNFSDLILHELKSEDDSIRRLSFAVAANSQSRPSAVDAPMTEPAMPTAGKSTRASLSAAPLDKRFTFDSFVVGKPNELAHAAAKRVAEGGPVTFNPLFLYGGVGLGKTHLMHAIAWELQTRRPDLNVLYLSLNNSCTASCKRCVTAR